MRVTYLFRTLLLAVGLSTATSIPVNAGQTVTGTLYVNGNTGLGTASPTGRLEVEGGDVGIGTWTPLAALTVFSSTNQLQLVSTTSGAYSQINLGNTKSHTTESLIFQNGPNYSSYGGNNSLNIENAYAYPIAFETNGSTSPNMIVDGTGNVGVNTLVPPNTLYVAGTAEMQGFQLPGNGVSPGNIIVGNGVGIGTWMAATTLPTSLTLTTTGSSGASTLNGNTLNVPQYSGGGSNYWLLDGGNVGINTANNVGIGTQSAVNALNVLGNIGIGTISYSKYLTTTAPNGGMIIEGNVGIGTINPQGSLGIGTYLANTHGTIFDSYGNIGIGTNITNFDSISVMHGNVGIGTFNADQLLTMNSANQTIADFIQPTAFLAGPQLKLENLSTSGLSPGSYGAGIDMLGSIAAAHDWFLGIYDENNANGNSPLEIFSASTGNVYWAMELGGNVGMGLNNVPVPKRALDVIGALSVESSASGFNTGFAFTKGTITAQGNIGAGTWQYNNTLEILGNGAFGSVYAGQQNAPTNGLLIQGCVGIGTFLPKDELQVGNYVTNSKGFLADSNGNVGIGTVATQTDALTVMSGNVGIGTWTASSKMQFGGTCVGVGPVGACWTSTGQIGYCSGVAGVCTSCTAC